MNNLKFFWPLIGVAGGIFLSSEIFTSIFFPLIIIGTTLLLWVAINLLHKDPDKAFRLQKLHIIWVIGLFIGIGALDYMITAHSYISEDINGKEVICRGVVKEVKTNTNGDKFVIKIDQIRDNTGTLIKSRNINLLLHTDGYWAQKGDKLAFITTPSKLVPGPRLTQTYVDHLRHQGIEYKANVKYNKIVNEGVSNGLLSKFLKYRDKLIIKLENSSLKRETAEFIISLLLGDKSYLRSDARETLSSAGLAHILALSGLHVAIILSIVLILFYPLALIGKNKLHKILALSVIWIYVIFTGAAFSTVRAAIMATLIIGALILERKNSSLNALLAASVLILLISPFALWDIGFQLSFLCVAAILLFPRKLNPIDQHTHPRMYKALNLCLITMITTLTTWSFVVYYFGKISLLFLPANLIILPLLPFFIGPSLLYLLLISMGIDWHILARFLDLCEFCIIKTAGLLSNQGSSVIQFEVPGISVTLWLIGILFFAIFLHHTRKKYQKLAASGALLSLVLSFIFIFSFQKESNKTLIFPHSFTKMEAQLSTNNELNPFQFVRGTVSNVSHPEFHITAIDNILKENSIQFVAHVKNDKPHFLIVGPHADFNQMAMLINDGNFEKIILHSGIGKNKKEELLQLIEENHWDKVYSLRENGSLEFSL